MSRNKIIGFGLAIVLFAALFKPAFINIHPENALVQLLAFIVLLVGTVVAGFLTNSGPDNGH